jgi:Type I restriction-modification system methyltransferase subunit
MAARRKSKNPSARLHASTHRQAATVGYEAQLWQMAAALRGSMDAAEYKHVVLGLIFLKYISDAFEEQHAKLVAEQAQGADPEDPDEYRAQNGFWVPPRRWKTPSASRHGPACLPRLRQRRRQGARFRASAPGGCNACWEEGVTIESRTNDVAIRWGSSIELEVAAALRLFLSTAR